MGLKIDHLDSQDDRGPCWCQSTQKDGGYRPAGQYQVAFLIEGSLYTNPATPTQGDMVHIRQVEKLPWCLKGAAFLNSGVY